MAKSKFVFKESFGQDMANLLASTDENLGLYDKIKREIIPLDNIVIHSNPRRLAITMSDIKNGLDKEDELYAQKTKEYSGLIPLSDSIREKGVLHDVHVYENNGQFVLAMGQRRVLASLLAERKTINAKIWKEKPDDDILRVFQWIENFNRESMSLWDMINAAITILKFYKKNKKITVREAGKVLYCSKSQAAYFCNLIDMKDDVQESIRIGKISSLKLAAEINKVEDPVLRKEILQNKQNLKVADLSKIKQQTQKKDRLVGNRKNLSRINLGHTKNKKVARYIIDLLCKDMNINSLVDDLDKDNIRDLSSIFDKILKKLEKRFDE